MTVQPLVTTLALVLVAIGPLELGTLKLGWLEIGLLNADEPDQPTRAKPLSNEELAAKVKASLVFIRSTDRSGSELGLGAGFVIDESGLIATARHVIGDGRDFVVELQGGQVAPVTEVYASSNQLDLAIIRVDATGLTPLVVSNEEDTAQGREVVAMGHPRGLRNGMASGIVSGHQDIDGIRMLQLAMPIAPGNSGGPVLDRQGNVVGVVTMKSALENDVGFALPAKLLRDLRVDPNPVPLARWRTIGALDSRQWKTLFGANWRQRAGRVTVNGLGNSFGGRTLCLRNTELPKTPFDLQVSVKLDNEQGAAGLVFHADGDQSHYGFYPSAGNLRLTRFHGPDVASWTILHNEPNAAYKAGDWNTLTVRIHADHFECYVNGSKVVESMDSVLEFGQTGLAAFRGTEAEFRRFEIGPSLLPSSMDSEGRAKIGKLAQEISPDYPADEQVVANLLPLGESAADSLNSEARTLERRAKQLRQLSRDLHDAATRRQIADALVVPIEASNSPAVPATADSKTLEDALQPDLLRAALLLAHMDNPDVDVDAYVARLDEMASELKTTFPNNASESQRLAALDKYLFENLGVRGSRYEYYTRSNSYLNEVIDDREGLPITLSVLYIELAKRVDLKMVGVGLPGHFVVRFVPLDASLTEEVIDPFEHGRRLSEQDILKLLAQAGFPNQDRLREAKTALQIMERMIMNLLGLTEVERNDAEVLRYLELLVMINPASTEYRAKRLEMRARTGRLAMAMRDADWFINNEPAGVDVARVRELRQSLEQQLQDRTGVK